MGFHHLDKDSLPSLWLELWKRNRIPWVSLVPRPCTQTLYPDLEATPDHFLKDPTEMVCVCSFQISHKLIITSASSRPTFPKILLAKDTPKNYWYSTECLFSLPDLSLPPLCPSSCAAGAVRTLSQPGSLGKQDAASASQAGPAWLHHTPEPGSPCNNSQAASSGPRRLHQVHSTPQRVEGGALGYSNS